MCASNIHKLLLLLLFSLPLPFSCILMLMEGKRTLHVSEILCRNVEHRCVWVVLCSRSLVCVTFSLYLMELYRFLQYVSPFFIMQIESILNTKENLVPSSFNTFFSRTFLHIYYVHIHTSCMQLLKVFRLQIPMIFVVLIFTITTHLNGEKEIVNSAIICASHQIWYQFLRNYDDLHAS